MKKQQRPQLMRIGLTLQAIYDAVLSEPLPERWVDLIKRLNEEEAAARNH